MIRSFAAVSVCIALGTTLILLGAYGTLPRNVQMVSYSDPVDENLGAEFDAVALTGELTGREFVVTLEVRGDVDTVNCVYSATIVARFADDSDVAHIYRLEFSDGWEHNYYVFTYVEDGDLVFKFPLSLLLDDAYIVGLEAALGGFVGAAYGTDLVNMGNRSEMSLSYALDLGFEPVILLIAGAFVLVVAAVAFTIKFGDRSRRSRGRSEG